MKESGYRFMLRAHGLRRSDVRALRMFEISDPEACQFLISNGVRGVHIRNAVQEEGSISRRDAVRKIVSDLLNY